MDSPRSTPKQLNGKVAWAFFAVFAFVIYLLPMRPSAALSVHQSIVDALLAGNNWGRQALIGSFDYPALPSLALLISTILGDFVRLDGARLLQAIALAWTLCYFVRTAYYQHSYLTALLPPALLFALPQLRNAALTLDPGWIAAVPFAAIFYHLVCWHADKGLRDLVLAGVNCGFLAFCGPGPLIAGLILVAVLDAEHRRATASLDSNARDGIAPLLWAPILYCIALWLLWNWLVMDDIFFGLRDLWLRADNVRPEQLQQHLDSAIPLLLFCLAPILILMLKSDMRIIARCLLPTLIILSLASVISAALGANPASLLPLSAVAALSVFTLVAIAGFGHPVPRSCAIIAALCCAFYAVYNGQALPPDTHAASAPAREELLAYIDQFWPDSRTVLYGLRLPALYPDPAEKRFIARLDYQEDAFLDQAKDEQLHILVPPPDGYFYPLAHSLLADLHANGRPWLFLEKQWPGNWQLWRCVIPPKGESRLEHLR
ncbi:MAG: hypothetical protein ACOX9E_09045 [Lentisphaeria bacterium]|jgi:hypothetical protein